MSVTVAPRADSDPAARNPSTSSRTAGGDACNMNLPPQPRGAQRKLSITGRLYTDLFSLQVTHLNGRVPTHGVQQRRGADRLGDVAVHARGEAGLAIPAHD